MCDEARAAHETFPPSRWPARGSHRRRNWECHTLTVTVLIADLILAAISGGTAVILCACLP